MRRVGEDDEKQREREMVEMRVSNDCRQSACRKGERQRCHARASWSWPHVLPRGLAYAREPTLLPHVTPSPYSYSPFALPHPT
ncbi:hypothetical protein MIMGU_mgv1a017306mg [Erythranthe guttata]|uniref:Uncharacterized protein n=1 Tax=Erythranthe guttata TaxID=4155 RepID=A0A022QVH9_ERYGU|nr:hypothetical protein MIMGU_mgv1a017306mg [Erythranthe guttata]